MNEVGFKIENITPQNVEHQTLFCAKSPKDAAFQNKQVWFTKRYQEGLRMKLLKSDAGRAIGFIEYIPAEYAWRPVEAPGFLFIHCLYLYGKQNKGRGGGSLLVQSCETDARKANMNGVCVMTSRGPWITDGRLFEKCGFSLVDERGRFQLHAKKLKGGAPDPRLRNWEERQAAYQGWHLLYADQCPWHEKSVNAIRGISEAQGINMQVSKIKTSKQAQNAPSGFGVFSLLKDGILLEDHYISATRFRNILDNEMKAS
ncbi:MAG: N-acetyltransferase [Saprospiraceae bacterium]|nr:N-acetyltransferase [Saprospiraceae bacterium]